MTPLKVVIRASALSDLRDREAWLHRQGVGTQTIRGYIRRVREACSDIGLIPRGGRPRDDLAPGLRTTPFEKSAVIAYVVRDERVEITNVFFRGRDYEALFRAEDDGA